MNQSGLLWVSLRAVSFAAVTICLSKLSSRSVGEREVASSRERFKMKSEAFCLKVAALDVRRMWLLICIIFLMTTFFFFFGRRLLFGRSK